MESLCKRKIRWMMDLYQTEVAKVGRITVRLFPGPLD